MKIIEVIDGCGTLSEFARKMEVPYQRARKWKERGRIPSEYWSSYIQIAKDVGVKGISADSLMLGIAEQSTQ